MVVVQRPMRKGRSGIDKGGEVMDVAKKDALKVGRRRAAEAARLLEEKLREPVEELCVLRPSGVENGRRGEGSKPVGEKCFVDVRVRHDESSREMAWIVIVDEHGAVKAMSERVYPLVDAVMRARSLGLPICKSSDSQLGRYLRRPCEQPGGIAPSDDSYIRWDL